MVFKNLNIALIVVGALGAAPCTLVVAGPIPTLTGAVTRAAPDQAIEVYWRGYGPGLGLGLAAAAFAGAAIAAPYYGAGRYYYYGAPAPYLYARPVYAAPYAYPPVYALPVYPGYSPYGYDNGYAYPSRCYTNEGYGRYRPCSAN